MSRASKREQRREQMRKLIAQKNAKNMPNFYTLEDFRSLLTQGITPELEAKDRLIEQYMQTYEIKAKKYTIEQFCNNFEGLY
jgi:hypothetical protein